MYYWFSWRANEEKVRFTCNLITVRVIVITSFTYPQNYSPQRNSDNCHGEIDDDGKDDNHDGNDEDPRSQSIKIGID